MTTYTKHVPRKPERSLSKGAAFGNYRRTGIPYNPRMTDKERKELMNTRR